MTMAHALPKQQIAPSWFTRARSWLAAWLAPDVVSAPPPNKQPPRPPRTVKCGLPAVAIFLPDTFKRGAQPKANERVVIPYDFTPRKASIHETILIHFVGTDPNTGEDLPDLDREIIVEDGADVYLREATYDGRRAFPLALEHTNGLSGPELAKSTIAWPDLRGSEVLDATFAVDESIMARICTDDLPPGYDKEPEAITVRIWLTLEGQSP